MKRWASPSRANEVNDIGNGFVMDDAVYEYTL